MSRYFEYAMDLALIVIWIGFILWVVYSAEKGLPFPLEPYF